MRQPFYIDATATDPTAIIGLTFQADSMVVVNPTKFTLLVRVGGTSKPGGVTQADLVFWPMSMMELPVDARDFCATLGQPQLAAPLVGMPTRCFVELRQGEPPAALGAASLAGQPPASGTLAFNQNITHAAGSYTDPVTLPAGTRSVRLIITNTAIRAVSIVGATSNNFYLEETIATSLYVHTTGLTTPITFVVDVDSDIDPTINVSFTLDSTSLNQLIYQVYAYQDRQPWGVIQPDARPMVDVLPPNNGLIPISPVGYDVPGILTNRAQANFTGPGTYQATFNRPIWASSVLLYLNNAAASPGPITVQSFAGNGGIGFFDTSFGGATGAGNVGLYEMGPGVSGATGGSIIDSKARPVPALLTVNFSCPLTGAYNFGVWYEWTP